jgi:hypothetical protein
MYTSWLLFAGAFLNSFANKYADAVGGSFAGRGWVIAGALAGLMIFFVFILFSPDDAEVKEHEPIAIAYYQSRKNKWRQGADHKKNNHPPAHTPEPITHAGQATPGTQITDTAILCKEYIRNESNKSNKSRPLVFRDICPDFCPIGDHCRHY